MVVAPQNITAIARRILGDTISKPEGDSEVGKIWKTWETSIRNISLSTSRRDLEEQEIIIPSMWAELYRKQGFTALADSLVELEEALKAEEVTMYRQ